jgi:alanyl-tRNA synthetase
MSTKLSSNTIVERYLSFFRAHGHQEIAGSPLVLPGNTTSFVIAGMQPLLPYLRGQMVPPSPRLTSLQRCLRSDDADAVGTNDRKNSAFFMLGNWSINDYDKRTAISLASEFLFEHLLFRPEQLWVSVFAGEPEWCVLPDEVAVKAWLDAGISRDHIVMLGTEDNFWTIGGGPGPCGPCTEVYMDRGSQYGCGSPTCRPGCECERFMEFWNLVFMEFERLESGRIIPLPTRNIDTGLGLERTAAALQGAESVFSIDLFQPALTRLLELAPSKDREDPKEQKRARRMILDHTRATLFAGLEGIGPGRDGRNSVVRRLIRRAARQSRLLGIERPILSELLSPLAEGHRALLSDDEYRRVPTLASLIDEEERLFSRVLGVGLRYLAQLEPDAQGLISGEQIFTLHAEKGFPSDLASEILAERGLAVDWLGYEEAAQAHRRVSRASIDAHFRTA